MRSIDEKRSRGRPAKGVTQVTFTLEQDVVEYLDSLPSGQKSEFANVAMRAEIERRRTCSMCDQPAEVECKIGKCAPSTWYCSGHYAVEHLPEDEAEFEAALIEEATKE